MSFLTYAIFSCVMLVSQGHDGIAGTRGPPGDPGPIVRSGPPLYEQYECYHLQLTGTSWPPWS